MSDTAPDDRQFLRVLIVDDEAAVGASLRRTLTRQGWLAEWVAHGAAALDRLASGGIDVVLVDQHLGDTGLGSDLLLRIAQQWPAVGRVLISGHAGTATIRRTHGWASLAKPWQDDQLLLTLRSAASTAALAGARQLLDRLPLAAWALDGEGRIILGNLLARTAFPALAAGDFLDPADPPPSSTGRWWFSRSQHEGRQVVVAEPLPPAMLEDA